MSNDHDYPSDSSHGQLFENTNHADSLENDLPTIKITSFGHRRGPLLPTPDLSFDCRALPNPPKNVRTGHTGLSKALRDALFSKEEVQRRFQDICTFINAHIRQAQANGEQSISVGVFCELGKHRSVSMVEQLGQTRFNGWNVVVEHRDVHLRRSNQKNKLRRDRHSEEDNSDSDKL